MDESVEEGIKHKKTFFAKIEYAVYLVKFHKDMFYLQLLAAFISNGKVRRASLIRWEILAYEALLTHKDMKKTERK